MCMNGSYEVSVNEDAPQPLLCWAVRLYEFNFDEDSALAEDLAELSSRSGRDEHHSLVRVPSWWCHSLLPQPLGTQGSGDGLFYALQRPQAPMAAHGPAASCPFAPLRIQAHPAVLMPQVSYRLPLLPAPRLRLNTAAPLGSRARRRCEAPPTDSNLLQTLLQPCSSLAITYYSLLTTHPSPLTPTQRCAWRCSSSGSPSTATSRPCSCRYAPSSGPGACMVRAWHGACMARAWRVHGAPVAHGTCMTICMIRPGLWSRAVRVSRHSSRRQPRPPSPGRRQVPRRLRLPWSRRLLRRPTRSSAASTRKRDGLHPTSMADGARPSVPPWTACVLR